MAGVLLAGCDAGPERQPSLPAQTEQSAAAEEPVETDEAGKPAAQSAAPAREEAAEWDEICININGTDYLATLEDNESARELAARLPFTITMSEHNGNEKFYNFPAAFPSQAQSIRNISSGDIMLFGQDCLVLFYDSFSTSYRYTPLGRIDETQGLADALGRGSVEVSFRAAE